jgi:pimeloyl-ACP methyl ester carboxylesterase
VLHDLGKVTRGMNKVHTLAAAESLSGSELPLLLAWAPGDRFFPIRYAERLAAEVGGAKLVRIPDSATFVPFDQPARLATEIAEFAPSS